MHGSCQLQPSGEESLCSPSETIDGLAVDGRSIVISTDSVCHGPESGDSTKGFEETGDTRRKALMRCCMTGDETRLKALLLFNSYDINWQDQSGRTPLSYAASGGHDNVIGFLQENSRVNPNLADNEGNTPLIYSAAMGHDAATLGLLKFPAVDVDQRNSSGFTALMKASIQDHVVCVEQLLSAGASMTLRDGSRGLTAIEWAKFCGSQESYVVLEAAAAAEAQRLQPDVGDGGFKRSTRGSFRSMTRPSSVRIRQAAAHSDKGADHLPSDGAAKAPGQKSGSGTAARLTQLINGGLMNLSCWTSAAGPQLLDFS